MMPSRKDNLYIIRMRGSISSVKSRWWESNIFRLSPTRYALLCFLLKEVKVPWSICLLKCFQNMLLNADIWWSFSTVKFMKDSFQERTQESGVGRARKAQVMELCSRPLRSRRFEIIKKILQPPWIAKRHRELTFTKTLFFSYSNQFQSWKNQHHCQKSRVVRLWDNQIRWIVLWWKASKSVCCVWSLS